MVNPFGNFGNIMKQAKEMQQKFKQTQEELANIKIQGEAGAGAVQLTINGNGEALNIKIDDAIYAEDKQILQGLIVAAINDAKTKKDQKKKELMGNLTSGMGLPADFDFLGKD